MSGRNGRNPKSPAFQLYPGDFLSDPKVAAMSAEEVGVYWLLLCAAWLDDGIPDDHTFLARIARVSVERFEEVWVLVGRCWKPDGSGKLRNPRQERERAFQVENRARRKAASDAANAAKAGRTGAESDTESEPNRSPIDPLTQYPIPDARTQRPKPDTQDPRPDQTTAKPRGKRKPPTGPNADAIRHWEAEWERTRLGTKYVVQPKDGVAVAWMLEHADPTEVQRRMSAMLEDPDAWIAANASLPLLRSKWDRFAVTIRPPAKAPTGLDAVAAVRARGSQ